MQVVVDVDEVDIVGVEEGICVIFIVDVYFDDVFEGVVRQVCLGSMNSMSSSFLIIISIIVVIYEVVIIVDNFYLKLKLCFIVNVIIYILIKDNVLIVFNKVLCFIFNKDIVGGCKINDCQSSYKVWILDNNIFIVYFVKIGIIDGSKIEIVSGIIENMLVVIEMVVKGVMFGMEELFVGEGERSLFMLGFLGSNKKKNK